tara:strand:- start:85 stop:276 length:192 start_codon:yes stop_codon:yes gene_type:complete
MTHYPIASNVQEPKPSFGAFFPSALVPKLHVLEAEVVEVHREMIGMIDHNLDVANALLEKELG